ncbi:probable G-protein coupled receptor 148 [Nerophis lumbriciformis]|uniref:probable G-protein coupled receptor 148 n=1 Tax=Nerophis lumbriciformis TaxID=546530 RepID=UPI002AE088CE|nr:probable G-protein coupled receptor 148 [Nerophis lumbriciformis]
MCHTHGGCKEAVGRRSRHFQQDKMTEPLLIANLTQEWLASLRRWHLDFFFIPTTVVTLATMLVNPVLMACILASRALRQETRYLLVANTLAADMLFLTVNLLTAVLNAARAEVPWLLCELVTAITVTAYCCAILTVTLMVVDTYAAVRWPLRYRHLLPPARARRILLGAWLLAATYPLALVVVMEVERGNPQEKIAVCLVLVSLGIVQAKNMAGIHIYFFVAALICAVLIFYCYIRLYMVTRTQGIWQNRFSRARVTLLAHGVLLLLYFLPGFVFTLELLLFQSQDVSQDVRVWLSTVNMCVFMLLPRAFAPYLYGLRYREISDTIVQLLHRH